MNNLIKLLGCAGTLLLSGSVYAANIQSGIQIENAWARATSPGQDSAMADLTITSKQAATLVGISSPASRTVELHGMTHENGMMKMREVKTLELPAGKPVNLGARGYHLMLIGLSAPLKAGETVPLVLDIQVAGQPVLKVETKAALRPLTSSMPQGNDGHMQHRH